MTILDKEPNHRQILNMPKKSTKRASAKRNNDSEGLWNRFVATMYRPKALILVALICLSPVIYGLAVQHLPNPVDIPESHFGFDEIQIIEKPDWIPDSLIRRTWEKAEFEKTMSIHESGLSKKLAEAFEESPWVESVKKVELRPMADVKVHINFRRPIAFVRTYNGLYPIDRNGVLLPPNDFTSRDRYRFPLISSAYSIPQGPAGTNWGDLAMIGAARLAELLTPDGDIEKHWKRFDFDSIEIPRPKKAGRKLEDVEYKIRTKGGSIIVWGDAPGIDRPREPAPEQKLKRVEKYWKDFGDFQKPHGPYVIDIRQWNATVREPITASNGFRSVN